MGKFDLIPFNNSKIVGLKAKANGKFVCADQNMGGTLIANRDEINDWEKFLIIDVTDEGIIPGSACSII